MELNIYHNEDFTCVHLVNIDATDSTSQLNRCVDSWEVNNALKPNMTYWKNDTISSVNSYKFNRVRFHYTLNEIRYTKDYFCISKIIKIDGLTLQHKF